MWTNSHKIDGLTRATVNVAWLIVANKPFYPLYVWYLAGDPGPAVLGTALSLPFFAAVPLLASRSGLAARVALPVIGTIDTLLETRLLGQASGTELFFAPCIMLAALSFRLQEKWWQFTVVAFVAGGFILSRALGAEAQPVFDKTYLLALLNINIFAVASLMTFLALRYRNLRQD